MLLLVVVRLEVAMLELKAAVILKSVRIIYLIESFFRFFLEGLLVNDKCFESI